MAGSSKLLELAIAQVKSISANPIFGTNQCARCQASLEVAKFLALSAPDQGSNFTVALCEYFNYSSSCEANYGPLALGPILTQVMSFADVGGYDGQVSVLARSSVISEPCRSSASLRPIPRTLFLPGHLAFEYHGMVCQAET